jgi:DNA-binding NarL/FixJ family response regulator
MERVRVLIQAEDPISRIGMVSQLRTRPELRLLALSEEADADVIVVVVNTLAQTEISMLKQLHRRSGAKLVLVPADIDDSGMSAVVGCGVVGVVRRSDASADQLTKVIVSAVHGEGSVPADLLGRLLEQMGRLQREVLDPRGLTLRGLTSREVDVLKLVADGFETREIATRLSYSERTVKNVLHGLTTRLQLRNRAHAVAYALRHDLI